MASPSDRRLTRAACALVVLLAAAAPASSQDTHYWSIQYGPVGQLVGGQLIGGADDLSATYYNPGALALRNESSYLLSTESFQWEVVSTTPTPGLEIFDTSSSHLGAAPSLLAGVLPRWFGANTHLAWSFLTRQDLDVRLGQRLTDPVAAASHSAAESYFDQDATEMWAGLTASRTISESVGLGATWYGVYRGQRLRNELSVLAVGTDGSSATAVGVTDFQYSHYRTLAKLGLSWRSRGWQAGLSITTPSLGVLGTGKAAYTLSVAGVDANRDGVVDPPVLATETAEDLDSNYRSSWAVGAGASHTRGDTRLYVSAEWYAAVDRFVVIEVPNGPADGGRLTQALTSVLNAGLGFEHVLSDDISVYGAFHTDFSALEVGAQANVAVSDWDLYHWSGGASFRIRDNRFTLGASWAHGSKLRPLESPIPPETVPAPGVGAEVDIRYSKLTFLLGFVFGR